MSNIEFEEIFKPNRINKLWPIYEEAFPPSERRDRIGFETTIANPNYSLLGIMLGPELVGLIGYWILGNKTDDSKDKPPIIFLEHLAIAESHRDKEIGGIALNNWLELITNRQLGVIVVLEADKATLSDNLAQRRLNFYTRAGFTLNAQHYTQPAYSGEQPTIPMELLSKRLVTAPNSPLSPAEFEYVRKLIHTGPYKLNAPIL